ncbi:MAG: NADH-quinone oxidoreductase subunit L [Deltaproteobacteria bacterium]|nr:NADH-quinone oxidoreductase subunit L [Deltaproteobacteria bacterium]
MELNIMRYIILSPLLGFLVNGIAGKRLNNRTVGLIACTTVLISFLIGVYAFVLLLSMPADARLLTDTVYTWISAGLLTVDFKLMIDPLSAVMVLVVSGVGFLIHVYSVGYMHGDRGYARYFSFLNLFMFSMLLLVLSSNIVLMFVGWEGVGLCSYLLIGFWYEKDSASNAGKKAFITNRIGDYGFLLGLFLLASSFAAKGVPMLDFADMANHISLIPPSVLTTIGILLFVGATGKSAQLPLYVWLPDAMEGPTPVSALIHAATMVTAGVYMIARMNFLYVLAPAALEVVAVVGALTALYAATIGLVQNDIKRVLAYSTISQLGYMFVGVGVGAFGAGIFHLMTHAFFKALLFLGAGSVMHALSGEQDMRKMGGLKDKIHVTHLTFLAAGLAISGIPGFSGFFSKDSILGAAYGSGHTLVWLLGFVTAFLTGLYIFRLIYMTFYGESRVDRHVAEHIHESPKVMTVPLVVLAVLSVVGGYIGVPQLLGSIVGWHSSDVFVNFLAPVFHTVPVHEMPVSTESWLMVGSIVMAILGVFLAWYIYVKEKMRPAKGAAEAFPGLYKLALNKYYVDEIYSAVVIRPLMWMSGSFLWKFFDVWIVDGVVNGSAYVTEWASARLRKIQTGDFQVYVMIFLIGVFSVLAYFVLR